MAMMSWSLKLILVLLRSVSSWQILWGNEFSISIKLSSWTALLTLDFIKQMTCLLKSSLTIERVTINLDSEPLHSFPWWQTDFKIKRQNYFRLLSNSTAIIITVICNSNYHVTFNTLNVTWTLLCNLFKAVVTVVLQPLFLLHVFSSTDFLK